MILTTRNTPILIYISLVNTEPSLKVRFMSLKISIGFKFQIAKTKFK